MGPRLRGDDAEAHIDAHFHLQIGFKLPFPGWSAPRRKPGLVLAAAASLAGIPQSSSRGAERAVAIQEQLALPRYRFLGFAEFASQGSQW